MLGTLGDAAIATYAIGGIANIALVVLIAMRGLASVPARWLAVYGASCALWAASVVAVRSGWVAPALPNALEVVRAVVIVGFTAHLLFAPGTRSRRLVSLGALALAIGLALTEVSLGGADLYRPSTEQVTIRLLTAIGLILLLENIYRNATPDGRWQMKFFVIGVGCTAGFDVVLYADALLYNQIAPALFDARGLVNALAPPLLVVACARSQRWRIDIHVSRTVVLQTATLVGSGIFLISAALAGLLLKEAGGTWGAILETAFLTAACVALVVLLTSGALRSRLRLLIARNFFSNRHDYRVEWRRFIDELSATGGESLPRRVVRALAAIVDSPGGILWLREAANGPYVPTAFWNVPAFFAAEAPQGRLVARLEASRGVVDLSELPSEDAPPWIAETVQRAWLAVPLIRADRLIGFAIVTEARVPTRLDIETSELLEMVGRQAASYVSEDLASRALADARGVHAYSQRFAFVAHDIKTMASQLNLVVANAEHHGDDPEFQRDVMQTVRASLARMNKLLTQLKAEAEEPQDRATASLLPVLKDAVAAVGERGASVVLDGADAVSSAMVSMSPDDLRASFLHILTNAVEASPPGAAVVVRLLADGPHVHVEIRDEGVGMSAAFIKDSLFRPLSTTKTQGHGIGAYQTRELIRAAGGELQIISAPGSGTVARITLPRVGSVKVPMVA